ncbi:ABC transporter substrate-binding protein [Paraburkholderia silvatlantica]|uniref:ABC transporter substrate-binding protein n=1 Tax=Paraburkholderia silvatlantica TaxID=321895 RepID=UPI0010E7F829|nr:ABC transporter substrate-binding protein [Paraburkholderia silvatlantica]TDR04889.1 peptide/nickel transport system substrate-binding protein [Paraburkholderia silvatlantica]
MITRRQFFQFAVAAAAPVLPGMAALPGVAFAASPTPQTAAGHDVLQAVIVPEPAGWVAGLNISNPAVIVSVNIFDGLVTYDDAFHPVPQLAQSWTESADHRTITFNLRKDVKWHDGHPFTSADVQYSLMEVTKRFHPRGNATFATLEAVDTPDDHTAVFRFTSPVPAVWSALGGYETQILPKHLYAGSPPLTNPLNAHPVGNGPYVFKEWARGNYVVLERNPDYWDRQNPPHFERIVFRIIPDEGTRLTALESGDLRYAPTDAVALPDLVRLRTDARFVVSSHVFDGIAPISFFDFNLRRKPFQDLRVRQAIAHAINRDALAKVVWYGLAKPAQGPIPSYQTRFFKPDLPQYNYDPAHAEALLDAAGFHRGADGVRLRINNLPLPFGNQYVLTAQFIQAQLRHIGVELTLVPTDVPTFNRRVYADYDFDTTVNWYAAFADPQLGVTRRYWSKSIKPGSTSSNATGYATPEMDRAIEGLVTVSDPVARKPFIDQLQQIAQEQVPSVNLLELHFYAIHAASLNGFSNTPMGAYSSLASVRDA